MSKIISLILAFLMSLLGLAPAVEPADAYTQAQWYALVVDQFDLTYDLEDGDNYGADAEDEYYEVLEACHDWNVIVGEYDADAALTDVVVAKSLAVAANLDGVEGPDDVAMELAIEAGIVSINVSLFGTIKESVISKDAANAALTTAWNVWQKGLRDTENGGTISTTDGGLTEMSDLALVENGDGLTLQTADGEVIEEEDIVTVDYEGSVNPFAQPEAAGINGQSILEDIEVDFSIGDLNVYAGLKDGGFDVSLGGNLNGIYIEKYYEVRDVNLSTKFEGNLSVNDVKTSYVIVDYNLTDRTTLTGHKSWSLDESELPEGSDDVDFFARVQNNLFEMREGSDSEITVFSVDVAIPNCPAITIGITAKLVITFDGRVDLVIVSEESKGVYIVDNHVKTINESESEGFDLTAQARVETVLGLYVDISIVSIVLVDVGIEVGLGVHVTVHMTGGTDTYTLDIPYDYLLDINFIFPNSENLTCTVNVKIYGIVTISVGENSDILEPLGLCETWRLVTEENGTFIDETFELTANQ